MLFSKLISVDNFEQIQLSSLRPNDDVLKGDNKKARLLLIATYYDNYLRDFPKQEKFIKQSITGYFWKSSLFIVVLPFIFLYALLSDKFRDFLNNSDDSFSCVNLESHNVSLLESHNLEALSTNQSNCFSSKYFSIFSHITKDGSLDILSSAPFISFPVMVLEAVITFCLYFIVFKSHNKSVHNYNFKKASKMNKDIYCLNSISDFSYFVGSNRILVLPRFIEPFSEEDNKIWSILTTVLSDGVPKRRSYFCFFQFFKREENDLFKKLEQSTGLVILASKNNFDKWGLTRSNTGREEVMYYHPDLYKNEDINKFFPALVLKNHTLLRFFSFPENSSIVDKEILELLINDKLLEASKLIKFKTESYISEYIKGNKLFYNEYIKKLKSQMPVFCDGGVINKQTNEAIQVSILSNNTSKLKEFLCAVSIMNFNNFVSKYKEKRAEFLKLIDFGSYDFENLKLNEKEKAVKNIFLHININQFVDNVLLSINTSSVTIVYGPPGTGKTTLVKNIMELLSSSVFKSVAILNNGEIKYKTSKPPTFDFKWGFILFNRFLESIHLLGLLYLYVRWHIERNKAVVISQDTKVFYGRVPMKQIDPSDIERQVSDILRELSLPLILFSGAVVPRAFTMFMKYIMDQFYFSRNMTLPFSSRLVYEEFKGLADFRLSKIKQALVSCEILFIENWEELSAEEKSIIHHAITWEDDGIYIFYNGNNIKTKCKKIIICSNDIKVMQTSNLENQSDKISYVYSSAFGIFNLDDPLLRSQLKNQVKAIASVEILNVFVDNYILMCRVLSELIFEGASFLFLVRDPFREIERLLHSSLILTVEDMNKACENGFLYNLNMLDRIRGEINSGVFTNEDEQKMKMWVDTLIQSTTNAAKMIEALKEKMTQADDRIKVLSSLKK